MGIIIRILEHTNNHQLKIITCEFPTHKVKKMLAIKLKND